MRAPSSSGRRITQICVGLTAALTLAACGGGSDDNQPSTDSESDDSGENESEDAGESSGTTVEMSGTIEALIGDKVTSYTIMVPEGFSRREPNVPTSPKFEDPTLEFGERDTRIELTYLPEPADAQRLIDNWLAVNSTITVFDQADEDGLSWYTSMTPSSSNPDEIAFGTATTSLTLANGEALQCQAFTQVGIDEEWSEDDARAMAEANLASCRTLTGG